MAAQINGRPARLLDRADPNTSSYRNFAGSTAHSLALLVAAPDYWN